MAQRIITEEQLAFLNLFKLEEKLKSLFYLTGGTALSYFYFQHRLSEDLDFFSERPFNLDLINVFINRAAKILNSQNPEYSKLFERHIFIFRLPQEKILKVEFSHFEHPCLEKTIERDGILVDNLLDLGANKVFCLFDRYEPKDYVDIYFLVKNAFSIKKLKEATEKKFQLKFDPITFGAQLQKGEDIQFPPKQLFKGRIEDIQRFFAQEAQGFKKEIFE